MKKTVRDVFDLTTSDEIENLVGSNAAPDISERELAFIKDKVYAKTGLKQPKKKKAAVLGWQAVSVAACLCLAVGIMLFGVGVFNLNSLLSDNGTVQNGGTKDDILAGPDGSQGGATKVENSVIKMTITIFFSPIIQDNVVS